MQCQIACAVAHSRSRTLYAALAEEPPPRSRIHVGAGLYEEGFPNRCRHCRPAPCRLACLPGAIYRDPATGSVLVDPDRCINCASCAMACPFGVIRYREDAAAPPGKVVAVKCDNCLSRQEKGLVPACVEVCKSGALTFETTEAAMGRRTGEVARSVSAGAETPVLSEGFALLNAVKRQRAAMRGR
jgi:carbon-monoxide dehydrogenase iron sulfur subunit